MAYEPVPPSAADDLVVLRRRVAELERQVTELEGELSPKTEAFEKDDPVLQELAKLRARIEQLEKENREFAGMYVDIQEQNEALTNLYVASQRLHATFDPSEVKTIISEILVEMVGAEEFGLLVLDKSRKKLHLVAGEGIAGRLPSKTLPAGEGVVGDVAATGQPFFFEPKTDAERSAHLPLATLPLELNGKVVGVVVIYRMLSHKKCFSPLDHQLLGLIAAHAASALVSARLHSTMDRKLKTIEGFMNLMRTR